MSASKYMKHFSPSTVNKFIEDKPGFYMEKVLGFPFYGSCAMEKGKAVESGITELLMGTMDEAAATKKAMDLYHAATRSLDVDDAAAHGKHLPELVLAGYEALKKYGKLQRAQIRVDFPQGWEGTALPWLGFADFEFDDVIVDLKVTSKTPSELRQSYARQGAFYSAALGKPTIFAHVVCTPTGKISVVEKEVEKPESQINVLTLAAKAMDSALKLPTDVLKAIWFPDPGAWQNIGAESKINEVWGI